MSLDASTVYLQFGETKSEIKNLQPTPEGYSFEAPMGAMSIQVATRVALVDKTSGDVQRSLVITRVTLRPMDGILSFGARVI